MGLLDDAIREHLDLKRRRGADPSEVDRAEQEALGPVRRDPFDHAPDDFESAPASDAGRAYDHEEEPYDDEGYEEYGAEEEWEDFEDEPHDPQAPHFAADEAPGSEAGFTDSTRPMDHEALDELEPPLADTPDSPTHYPQETGAGDETMQYDVEEALASESAPEEPGPEWAEASEEWAEPGRMEPERGSESPMEPGGPPRDFESDLTEPGVKSDAPDEDDHGGNQPDAGPQRASSDDDVLEETPEFLQDAPDHDRLWFEQRPPRDFDFDG
jgi:hypothetical protein